MAESVLKSLSVVEEHVNEVARLRDSMQNFQMQLSCVEKVPTYCAMVQCSPRWRSKLIAKLHAECTQICQEYVQHWTQMEQVVAQLSDYLISLRMDQRTVPSSTHADDLTLLVEYLRKEAAKYHAFHTQQTVEFGRESELDYQVQQAVQRIRADLSIRALVPT